MSKNRVLILTCQKYPDISTWNAVREDLVVKALQKRGVEVRAQVWDELDLEQVDRNYLLLLRAVWDYHLRVPEFSSWLAKVEDLKVKVMNPIPIVKWNIHKSYLLELSEKGIPIPDTMMVKKGSDVPSLPQTMTEKKRDKLIVKACIGAQNFMLERIMSEAQAAEYQDTFREQLQHHDMLVQEYIEGVEKYGEWSLLFFNRQFSHCVNKMPLEGDYRAFILLGGAVTSYEPSQEMLDLAEKVLALVPGPLLYARVDLMKHHLTGKLYLGELELIEPTLFLDFHEKAPERLADAILSYMQNPDNLNKTSN